ncbi:MAG: glutathione S-transferase [Pseudomonadota bacterium]
MTHAPILYSFRRCPYAMRARLAIASAGIAVDLREIVLRDKAPEFLATSPKGTVPVLVDGEHVIEESLDIMNWALQQSDPEGLLERMTGDAFNLITTNDGPFKSALDRTKYAVRFPELDPENSRAEAATFVQSLDDQLAGRGWLLGDEPAMVDFAILPFIRQFAHTDQAWWDAQPFPNAQRWLAEFKASDRFAAIMSKYPKWVAGNDAPPFP